MYEWMPNDDELKHYGVKGMKWGVIRNLRNKIKTTSEETKKKRSIDAAKKQKEAAAKKAASEPLSKKIKKMSDKDLNDLYTRMELEKKVLSVNAELSRLSPQQVSAGKKFINQVSKEVISPALKESGKKVLTAYLIKQGMQTFIPKDSKKKDN